MSATRWEPFAQMNRLRDEMDRLFERWNEDKTRSAGPTQYPPLNLWEDDDHLYVEAELPGFEIEHLEIIVNGGDRLHLQGERKVPELESGTWHRRERGFGKFSRLIELPGQVDSEGVTAQLKHGVLTITLPKRADVKPRKINVQVS